ncbi:MAG TPA: phosphomannomutase/phosphoglucomutase, partial [Candidatus Norongarragalinales archaeon]|nr:phosphomannomutase/phosphoglucomutase [Candidatus Norongarragalinales archaeon]
GYSLKDPSTLFREYDVRGLLGKELDDSFYSRLGSAFFSYVESRSEKKPSCVVGRDNRPSSVFFASAFMQGFVSAGGDVIDVGMVPTPAVYFANRHFATLAGCAITASHNPPEYNGAKFVYGAQSVGGKEVQAIKDFFLKMPKKIQKKGTVQMRDLKTPYLSALTKNAHVKNLNLVVDAGNGAASDLVLPFFEKLDVTVIPIHCDASRPFSVHLPDPVDPENYPDLCATVKKKKADLGLMFDGDGDRLGAVDSAGNIVWPDQLLALFARGHLRENPGAKIMVEIKCSQGVIDDVVSHGGIPVWSPTGRTRIESMMQSENAGLAGEMSGHFFFPPLWLSDAFFAARRLLEIVSKNGPLEEQLSDFPKYFSSQEYRVTVTEKNKFEIVRRLTASFKKDFQVLELDGAKVLFPDGWGLVRASNNEPKLSLRFEGKTRKALDRIQSLFRDALEAEGVRGSF